jgi:hypothetical protein
MEASAETWSSRVISVPFNKIIIILTNQCTIEEQLHRAALAAARILSFGNEAKKERLGG